MKNIFQNTEIKPTIYAYELPKSSEHQGLLKIGDTRRNVVIRVKEQLGTAHISYKIVLEENAIKNDGTYFRDTVVHDWLKKNNIECIGGEWYRCDVATVKKAIYDIKNHQNIKENLLKTNRTQTFGMRPEQLDAVERTAMYFNEMNQSNATNNVCKTSHFLWNAKMRFGKTFTSYQLAKKMGWTKILILTFKPAVENAWKNDLENHIDFEGWQFSSKKSDDKLGEEFKELSKDAPIVCFGSFQDYLKTAKNGKIKLVNKWVHQTIWDCIIFDEYHFGAWNNNAKELFITEEAEDNDAETIVKNAKELAEKIEQDGFDEYQKIQELEENLPIKAQHFLYLSGTPFRAIDTGEFIEEQIFNWTYTDEQHAKHNWNHEHGENPYAPLPNMVMMTYELPEYLQKIANQGEFDGFDLSVFFSAITPENDKDLKNPEKTRFKYQNEVQKWLDWIRNKESNPDEIVQNLKSDVILPFENTSLLATLNHTFWFLPSVASCYAMKHLLNAPQNQQFYGQYEVLVVAGKDAGIGIEALKPVEKMLKKHGLCGKSITLSCGKLTTGVSVKEWTGIFMLRNCSSPETYFQTAFRVQTPWIEKGLDDNDPNKIIIIKKVCYVFDFSPNRALKQVADYVSKLNIEQRSIEKGIEEFINFLPILAYDGIKMEEVNAQGVLDFAIGGISGSLLAKRWQSALLVHVDNDTLERLLNDKLALNALQKIEGFKSLNSDLETIISRNEHLKGLKKEQQLLSENDDFSDLEEKNLDKEIDKEKKELNNLRKKIQEKLIQFISKIPIFMYLTDYREQCLHDVIIQLEPELFEKVTGLSIQDFEILVNLKLFNATLMNDAIYKFQRYEANSLNYLSQGQKDFF